MKKKQNKMRHLTYAHQHIQCHIESEIEICISVMVQPARLAKELMCPVPPHGLMHANAKASINTA